MSAFGHHDRIYHTGYRLGVSFQCFGHCFDGLYAAQHTSLDGIDAQIACRAREAPSDRIVAHRAAAPLQQTALDRKARILEIELHTEEVTGADKSLDVVVDIFNKVNSGGTKLSKGDLALAKICADWPEGRDAMKANGATILGEPRIGAHGTLIIFVHPKNSNGVLIELMETPKGAH
jgi:hypothetical protein